MILVTGASGTVGRPLVELLVAAGLKVRAVARNPAGLPRIVEVVDKPVLEGVTGLFANPRAIGADLVGAAKEHGVRRVVALSAANVDDDLDRQPSRWRGDRNREVERAVTASGLDWVALRPWTFAANSFGLWAEQIRRGDEVRGSYAKATWSPIHERDIAEVAVRAFLDDNLLGMRPVLTGPESLTQEQMVRTIGDAIGRELNYVEAPPDLARQAMVAQGLPAEFAARLLAMQARSVGVPAPVTNEVRRILGRPALTFARWAADNAYVFGERP
ncbi:NAD(P)H-binding protein [Kutzneria sp. CA-103260]|uniref:NAD(P)H-binding protein n=1 Tax=Kutzneria sp. CA-103260 TaxID=2802641 RepID=UPI001BA70CFB|nr:NAD(P)H-binding protein [Kutzneria sp. CA-103260]QUQ72288.1 nucleotide-diphosphate-sugar epimerase/NmrA family protein [Kutzneria sp. CA-103260]